MCTTGNGSGPSSFPAAGGGGPGANEYAGEPAIAGGGRFVAFYTPADNIDPPGQPAYHGNFPPATNVYRFQFAP